MILHRSVIVLVAAATSLFLGVESSGQDFPAPKPGEAHKPLAAEAGTWDSTVTMFLEGPQGPPTVYKDGVEVVEMVGGGLFLKSKYTATFGDRKFEGHGLMGYDPSAKEYVMTWVDNFSVAPFIARGTYDSGKKTITFKGTSIGPNGEKFNLRQVTTLVDAKTKKFESFMVLEGGVEFKMMEILSKKKG